MAGQALSVHGAETGRLARRPSLQLTTPLLPDFSPV